MADDKEKQIPNSDKPEIPQFPSNRIELNDKPEIPQFPTDRIEKGEIPNDINKAEQ